jgi:predicted RNase H-like HicB family nuclease/uncharacterized protein (DUF433 family)
VKYRVYLEQDEDGVFVATYPSLPGCISQGRMRSEVAANMREAIEGYYELQEARRTGALRGHGMMNEGDVVAKEYVENVEGTYRVAGSRVSLDSIVYGFREGLSPETIAENFPALTLEQVYGAIAFYLANQPVVDQYLREGETVSEELQLESRRRNADLITRLQRARHESQIPG